MHPTRTPSRFSILDARIKRNLIEAGQDLQEIRDNRLYESGGFKSFSAYCESIGKNYHWGWRTIEAGKIQAEMGIEMPNESTARAISQVAAPMRREVVNRALEQTNGKLTAPAIKNAVASLPASKKASLDGTGMEIPPEIAQFWDRNKEVNELLAMVKSIRLTLEKAQGRKAEIDSKTGFTIPGVPADKLFKGVDLQGCISKLHSLHEELECAKSYAVCPSCNGVLFEDCPDCRGRGSLSKFHWNMVSEDIKKLRKL